MVTSFISRASVTLFASLSLLLLLLLALAKPAIAQDATDVDPITQAITTEFDLLLQPEISSIQGAEVALIPQLHDFYSRRGFRPAWNNRQSVEQLLKAIADSEADGLDPNDYHAKVLQALAVETDRADAAPTAHAQFDVLLTEALMRLGYHLTFGKVDPESLDPHWKPSRP
jgi:murein L,D-transpeptidase YcbB/YkuD